MGRPTKLSPDVIRVVCEGLRNGLYLDQACSVAGIHPATAYRWRERAEQEEEGLHVDFRDAVDTASAEAEARATQVVLNAAERGDWRAAAWYLEHRHPTRWGRKEQHGVSIAGPQPIALKIVLHGEPDEATTGLPGEDIPLNARRTAIA